MTSSASTPLAAASLPDEPATSATTAPNFGRTSDGRFAQNNRGGSGNPFNRHVAGSSLRDPLGGRATRWVSKTRPTLHIVPEAGRCLQTAFLSGLGVPPGIRRVELSGRIAAACHLSGLLEVPIAR